MVSGWNGRRCILSLLLSSRCCSRSVPYLSSYVLRSVVFLVLECHLWLYLVALKVGVLHMVRYLQSSSQAVHLQACRSSPNVRRKLLWPQSSSWYPAPTGMCIPGDLSFHRYICKKVQAFLYTIACAYYKVMPLWTSGICHCCKVTWCQGCPVGTL